MSKYTFDDFVAPRLKDKMIWPRNSYVSFPGWLHLYVRVSHRLFEAKKKSQGTFKKLVAHIRQTYPGVPIHVESVLSEQFCKGLPRMGFIPRADHPTSFYLLPETA